MPTRRCIRTLSHVCQAPRCMGTWSLGAGTRGCLQSRVPPAPRRCSGWLRAQHHIRHLAGLGGCSAKAKGARWSVFCLVVGFSFSKHPLFLREGFRRVGTETLGSQTPPCPPQGVLTQSWKSLPQAVLVLRKCSSHGLSPPPHLPVISTAPVLPSPG